MRFRIRVTMRDPEIAAIDSEATSSRGGANSVASAEVSAAHSAATATMASLINHGSQADGGGSPKATDTPVRMVR